MGTDLARRRWLLGVSALSVSAACGRAATPEGPVRCAVIAGMMTTGLFPAVAERFTAATRIVVSVVSTGNKRMIEPAMRRGEADLITMHTSDEMANLVADGLALDAVPWARNDHVIVGPKDDPAGIRGMTDAGDAMRKIVAAGAPFVEHRATGAGEVLQHVLAEAHVALSDEQTTRMPDGANQEQVLELAAEKHAYSLVGRIPFQQGKLQGRGIELMLQGDPRLRRAYLVAVANPKRLVTARYPAAQALSAFLRSPETQRFLVTFASERFGGRAPFAPVETP